MLVLARKRIVELKEMRKQDQVVNAKVITKRSLSSSVNVGGVKQGLSALTGGTVDHLGSGKCFTDALRRNLKDFGGSRNDAIDIGRLGLNNAGKISAMNFEILDLAGTARADFSFGKYKKRIKIDRDIKRIFEDTFLNSDMDIDRFEEDLCEEVGR